MQNISFTSIANKYGFPLGLLLIVITLLAYLAGVDKEQWLGFSIYAIYIIAVIFSIQHVKKNQDGKIEFSGAFKVGFYTLLVAILISTLYFFIHISFIDTQYFDALADVQRSKMQEMGMSEEQIVKAMDASSAFMKPAFSIPISLFSQLFVAVIISAVCGAVMKRE